MVKKEGFSLIELIVVLIIAAILCQLGFIGFNRYVRKSKAFAAREAIRNIKSECISNSDLGLKKDFTLLDLNSYSKFTVKSYINQIIQYHYTEKFMGCQ